MYTVAAALYPDALATSITLPMEILRAASQTASLRHRGQSQIKFLLAANTLETMELASGLKLVPDVSFRELPPVDLLLLPAIWRSPTATIRYTAQWQAQITEIAAAGSRICSVGTASCLLAEAGLLTDKPATTHWNYFQQFARRYPRVNLKTRHLITQSESIYCVGSVNSIADLMVHLVEEWFGQPVARAVENQFSPEIRRSFSAAAYQNEPQSSHHDEVVAQAQSWLRENLGQRITMASLARKLDLSARSLGRRFQTATGLSPLAYLQSLRMGAAKDLLRHSNLSVGEIAWQVGMPDHSHFSRLFKRQVGMPPLRYRSAVRGKLFAPQDDAGQLE